MSNYIVGYTNLEFNVEGLLLPKKTYTQEEKARGKKDFLAVSEDDMKKLQANKVFNILLATKKIRVLDKLPSWAVTGVEREAALQAKISALETTSVTKENHEAAINAVTAEAQSVIDDLRAQLAEATKDKE